MLVPKTDFKRFYKPSKLYLCVTEINGLIITIYILIFREIILAFAHHPLPEQRLLRCLFTFKFNQVSNGQLLAWSRHRNEHENIITVSCIWASEHLSIWSRAQSENQENCSHITLHRARVSHQQCFLHIYEGFSNVGNKKDSSIPRTEKLKLFSSFPHNQVISTAFNPTRRSHLIHFMGTSHILGTFFLDKNKNHAKPVSDYIMQLSSFFGWE